MHAQPALAVRVVVGNHHAEVIAQIALVVAPVRGDVLLGVEHGEEGRIHVRDRLQDCGGLRGALAVLFHELAARREHEHLPLCLVDAARGIAGAELTHVGELFLDAEHLEALGLHVAVACLQLRQAREGVVVVALVGGRARHQAHVLEPHEHLVHGLGEELLLLFLRQIVEVAERHEDAARHGKHDNQEQECEHCEPLGMGWCYLGGF